MIDVLVMANVAWKYTSSTYVSYLLQDVFIAAGLTAQWVVVLEAGVTLDIAFVLQYARLSRCTIRFNG